MTRGAVQRPGEETYFALATSARGSLRSTVVPQAPADMSLFMGRCFRAGWSADGRFIHSSVSTASNLSAGGRFMFQILHVNAGADGYEGSGTRKASASTETTLRGNEEGDSQRANRAGDYFGELLGSVLAASTMHLASERDDKINRLEASQDSHEELLPQWKVARADPKNLHEYLQFAMLLKNLSTSFSQCANWNTIDAMKQSTLVAIKHAVGLVDALCGQETSHLSKIASSSHESRCLYGAAGQDEEIPSALLLPMFEARKSRSKDQ